MRFERHGLKGMGAAFMISPREELSGEVGMERGGSTGRRDVESFDELVLVSGCVAMEELSMGVVSMLHALEAGCSCRLSKQR
jgi:hypothetical protein